MTTHCPKCNTENPDDSLFCAKCGIQLIASEGQEVSFTKTLLTPIEDLTQGTLFAGRYEIIDELGKGGMGKVYKALDNEIHVEVAIKLLKSEIAADEKIIERFRNELKIAREIAHKNVCKVFHFGKEEGTPYITMEFVQGKDLKSLIKKKEKLTKEEALGIAKQVCLGLAEAHELGVVHRDLKPQNIMIDENGNAKIMDFGIARSVEAEGVTEAGMIIGTPDYISPEQAEGEQADHRSDIYSLGVILYEMVTGTVPFKGDTALSVALKHKSQFPLDPRKLNPDVADDLSRLILICMEKSRERRYQTAAELLTDIKNIEDGFPLGTKIQPRRKTFAGTSIKKKLFIPSVVVVLGVIAVLFWQILSQKNPTSTLQYKHSIAVLPFKDLSPAGDQEPQCESLAEVLIIALNNIQDLYVPGRFSSVSFKDKEQNPVSIGNKLNVDTVLLGSLQNVSGQLRITAQMVKVADGSTIWSDMYEGQMENIFDIQDKLISSVVQELELNPSQEELEKIEKQYTENAAAYELYLKGRFFQNKWTLEGCEKAIPFYLEALEKDPEYVLPYVGLAFCYNLIHNQWEQLSSEEAYEKAKKAIDKALEIDNQLGDAHAVLAEIKIYFEYDFEGYENSTLHALELDPRSRLVRESYHMYLFHMGRLDEAAKEAELLVQRDPLNSIYYWMLGRMYYFTRRYEDSLSAYRKALEFEPSEGWWHWWQVYTYLAMGKYDEARYEAGLFDPIVFSKTIVDAAMGKLDEVQSYLEKQKNKTGMFVLLDKALIYGALNDKENTLRTLEELYKGWPKEIPAIAPFHFMDCVRSDPRFVELVENARYLKNVPSRND